MNALIKIITVSLLLSVVSMALRLVVEMNRALTSLHLRFLKKNQPGW